MPAVKSSMFSHLDHDPKTNTLITTFKNGKTYSYEGVDAKKFGELMAAPSPGQFFGQHIKPHHKLKTA